MNEEPEEEFSLKGMKEEHAMSHREIAARLGMPRSTVANLEYRALRKAREMLTGKNREDFYD